MPLETESFLLLGPRQFSRCRELRVESRHSASLLCRGRRILPCQPNLQDWKYWASSLLGPMAMLFAPARIAALLAESLLRSLKSSASQAEPVKSEEAPKC